jgi:hypothetical protein
VKLFGVGPARKARHRIELTEEASDQLVGVVLRAQLLEFTEDPPERLIGIRDGALREVFPLRRKARAVPHEFLTIEVGRNTDSTNPLSADEACHATLRVVHILWVDRV